MEEPTPEETMKAWTVVEVGAFLERKDLRGAAATFRRNDVAGTDLFGFSHTRLVQELALTPFAATKVLQARDAFLAVADEP